jgi:hypothetical protein
MEILNFRAGIATKFARGLNDGLKINWGQVSVRRLRCKSSKA